MERSSILRSAATAPTASASTPRRRDRDRRRSAAAFAEAHAVVRERVGEAGDEPGCGDQEPDRAGPADRVDVVLGAERLGQRVVLREHEDGRERGRNEQPQAAGHDGEDDDRRDGERHRAALALGAEPACEHRRSGGEGGAAQQRVELPPCREHQGGPEADEEERGGGIHVGDRGDEPAAHVQALRVGAEAGARRDGDRARAQREDDDRGPRDPLGLGPNPARLQQDREAV